MAALPHKPQLDEAKTCRVRRLKSTLTERARNTFKVFLGEALWRQGPIAVICSRLRIIPSPKRNPAANSGSCPGVRMVTAIPRPRTRISRGSSTASVSKALADLPERGYRHSSAEIAAELVSVGLAGGLAGGELM